MNAWSRLFLAVFLTAPALPAAALDPHVGGFGTASLSCFDDKTADYVINEQPKGPGRSRRCDTGLDSILGLQLDLGLSPSLDFGLQVVANHNADDDYTPDVTVAQLRLQLDNATSVRLGRMPTVAFLHAEDRQVRFAHPWVRPPPEVYSLIPAFSSDGLEISHQNRLGGWHAQWQALITALKFDVPVSNTDRTYPVSTRQALFNLSLRDSNTLIKFSYAHSLITLSNPALPTLFNRLRGLGAGGADLADELAVDDSPFDLFIAGIRQERGDWLALGEIVYRGSQTFIRDQLGAYVTLGRRFGCWMPYATLAGRWTRGPDGDSRAGPLQPQVSALLASTRFDNTSASLGLSREINDHATLKFQADRVQPARNSWGLYTNHSPTAYDYADPGANWLFTVSLDFVF